MVRKLLLVMATIVLLFAGSGAPAFATDEDDCTTGFRCTTSVESNRIQIASAAA